MKTRKEIIDIILKEKVRGAIYTHFFKMYMRMNELEFIEEVNNKCPFKLTGIIRNRYVIS